MPLVPFYGSRNPDMFAIERCSMDPRGLVGSALERRLPAGGPLLDIGAGDGFLASRLCHSRRVVVAMEPDPLTVAGDSRFDEFVEMQPNLPAHVKQGLPRFYGG